MCLWILFAGVFFYGLWTLITGVQSVSRRKSVQGLPARLLGAALMLLPAVCIAAAFLTALICANANTSPDRLQMSATIASFATLLVGVLFIMGVAFTMAKIHTSVGGHKKSDVDMKHLSNIDAGGEPNFDALAEHDRASNENQN